jgi:hypothetical protein
MERISELLMVSNTGESGTVNPAAQMNLKAENCTELWAMTPEMYIT